MDSTLTLILRLLAASDTSKPATLCVSDWHVLLVKHHHHQSSLMFRVRHEAFSFGDGCAGCCDLLQQSGPMERRWGSSTPEPCRGSSSVGQHDNMAYGYMFKRASTAHRLKTTYAALMRARRKMIHHTDGMAAVLGCVRGHQYRSYVTRTRASSQRPDFHVQ